MKRLNETKASPKRLALTAGVLTGALALGGCNSAGEGFFSGAAIGAASGAVGAMLLGQNVAKTWGQKSPLAKTLFPGDTGHFLCMGPITNPRFAWILLDRAVIHAWTVRDRAHARRDELVVETTTLAGHGVAQLEARLRDPIDRTFREVLKQALNGSVSREVRDELQHGILALLDTRDES